MTGQRDAERIHRRSAFFLEAEAQQPLPVGHAPRRIGRRVDRMAKKRVHELAKDLGFENKDMVAKLQGWGYDGVKSHSSTLEDDQVRSVTERILSERKPTAPKPSASGVVIRRSKALNQTIGGHDTPPPPPEPAPEPPPAPVAAAPAPEAASEPATTPVAEPAPAPTTTAAAPAVPAPTTASTTPPAPATTTTTATTPAPAAPATPAVPLAATPATELRKAPTPNQAVRVDREAPGFIRRPAVTPATVIQATGFRKPGVSGTAANTRVAPTIPTAKVVEPPRAPHVLEKGEEIKADEEIKLINGVPHVVQKQGIGGGRPTANQAVVLSRPVYIANRVTPTASKTNYPQAPGIKAGQLTRPGIREVEVVNEGGRRDLREVGKGRRPGAVRNEKVENYSKQDLLDLVRARTYVPVIGRKKRATKKGKKTEVTAMKASKKVISIEESISIRELSEKMGVKAQDIIRKLMKDNAGKLYTVNQQVDYDTATLIATDHGWEVTHTTFEITDFVPEVEDKPEDLKPRPPVVTVMGHVDHGKTSLLDALRQANVAEGEAGGITQHIGAYSVTLPGKGDITFLDTPGHEAFSAMRSRGAQATDLVILVVAADDGVQPQTLESIKHAKAAEVPIVVAINKIDKPGTNPDQIKGALASAGLQPEDWGGDTPMVPVSARQKTNLDLLLENLLLQAEVLELSSNPNKSAKGVVIESKLDRGRGAVSTVLVQDGTLKSGDAIVCGIHWGRVRTMTDEKGKTQQKVTAGYPIQVVGLSGTPEAGEDFDVVPDEVIAKKIADHRALKARQAELAKSARLTIEDLAKKIATDAAKELVIIVKADVQGSAEAVTESLRKLSGKKVVVNVIARGVGGITENDVNQAKASKAMIVGFNVKPDGKAASSAQQDEISVKSYSIIYELIDDVRTQMENMLEPIYKERPVGKAEVKQVFSISKLGTIAGSLVTEGKITRTAQVRVVREKKIVYTGKLSSLKRFKDDAKEVVAGTECGIAIEGFPEIIAGDILDAFEVDTFRQKLD
jgi:translation initiation factor IF-2